MISSRHQLAARPAVPVDLGYLLYQPATPPERGAGYPLLLFLHGMGDRGDDLDRVKQGGPPARIEQGAELPFLVAAPQCPLGAVWQTDKLIALVDELVARHPVDPTRIFVTGLSMGGAGTWALANAYPQRFAAIAPVCGPFTMVDPVNFKSIPVWCFHGAMDTIVPLEHSLGMVRSLRNHGADVRLTIYPDTEHDAWTQAYAGTELYDWLLTRGSQPKGARGP